jgi:hypothetical protein
MNATILSISDLSLHILEGLDSDKIVKHLKVAQFKFKQEIEACFTSEGVSYALPRA